MLLFFFGFLLRTTAGSASCTTTFNGLIPEEAEESFFTSDKSPYNPKYVLGQNLTWDKVVSFPDVEHSRYDWPGIFKPFELEITDESIFVSSSEGAQTALRRAELLVNKTNTVSEDGLFFLSMRTTDRPLNLSHEYLLAFHEAQDYQADFWSVKVGVPMVGTGPEAYGEIIGFKDPRVTDAMLKSGEVLYVQGHKWASPVKTYFMTPFTPDLWHNLGLYRDYDHNEMQVYYSTANSSLQEMTPRLPANLSGKAPTTLGETHFGIQKRPVGATLENFLYEGGQELGINESMMFGGIWALGEHPDDCGVPL